jgi:hypothetical protein
VRTGDITTGLRPLIDEMNRHGLPSGGHEHRRPIEPETLRRLLEPKRKLTPKQRRARDWSTR